ncbi:MAG: hypothetical protein KAS75_02285 [Planctomycetes bacterium]|nr:hypothetical protein [Planctomycetota bacterium]
MNISHEDAQQSLAAVEQATAQVGKSIAALSAGSILILWGLIWILSFLVAQFFLAWVWYWMVLGAIGTAGTILICRKQSRTGIPVKSAASKKIGWKYFWSWTALFVYATIWLFILEPRNSIQSNAFFCTIAMFAYVIMGLWDTSRFLLWLGLGVTVCVLIGYYLVPHQYYCLWMAPTGGGALLVTGIYQRWRWR